MTISIKIKHTVKEPKNPQATLLFGGDFCPIRRYEEKILNGEPIFSPALERELSKKDFFIVNLESPLCNDICNPKLHNGGMGCDGRITAHLKKFHIDAVGLANNHILDKTGVGVLRTVELLNQNGIIYGGAGSNLKKASEMIIFDKNGFRIGIWALAEKELNVATDDSPGSSFFHPELNVLEIPRLREQVDFLVCFIHAGHEFMLTPSPRIRKAYRSFIEAGADTVIGHHPHVPQGYEQYHKGWIFYSLGNLVFDSPYVSSYAETDHGYLVKMKIGRHNIFDIDIIPYHLRTNIMVEELSSRNLIAYKHFIKRISQQIIDDVSFAEEWQRNVVMRWKQDYQKNFMNLSARFGDHSDQVYLSWLRNFIQCPTHEEITCEIINLLENNTLVFSENDQYNIKQGGKNGYFRELWDGSEKLCE